MEHTESSIKLFYSNDYARFRMINGNRQLNEGKINRIIKEIGKGNDMLRYAPIQVKENGNLLEILDGQHRFWISRKLHRPVYYVLVKEDKTMADIARVNSNVEKWKNTDFINCYVQQGNEHYKLLQLFIDTYGIGVGTSVNLLSAGNPMPTSNEQDIRNTFEDGLFEAKCFDSACVLAEDWLKFASFDGKKDRNFITALYKVRMAGLIEMEDLTATYQKYPDQLTKQPSVKDYLYHLEKLFNTRKQIRTVII